jgi:hypothetical protein
VYVITSNCVISLSGNKGPRFGRGMSSAEAGRPIHRSEHRRAGRDSRRDPTAK